MRSLITFIALIFASLSPCPAQEAGPRAEDKESKFDQIIDRFIEYDTGKLPGPEGKQAVAEFASLGNDAIPALIRGLNKAAKIEHSCPAVTIAKKLNRMLRASRSPELLEFARENIGAGVTESRHMGVIRDLRIVCMFRKRALADSGVTTADEPSEETRTSTFQTQPKSKRMSQLSVAELAEALKTAKGLRVEMILTQLGKRNGHETIDALATFASTHDGEYQKLAREYLKRVMDNLDSAALEKRFKDERAEVRAAAARLAGGRSLRFADALIGLLADSDETVNESARQSLVRLSRGKDFGPTAGASESDRKKAAQQWRAWLSGQDGR
jgi:hypothetical protein